MKIERLSSNSKTDLTMKSILFTIMMISSVGLFAQVKGVVKDASTGEPLVGASVLLKGTTTGTVTGLDGDFSINAKSGDILQISYTGFTALDYTVGDEPLATINLVQGAIIDEVLVTGYSTQKKKDLTGAVSIVKSKDLVAVPQGNFINALEGRAAGVTIGSSGEPGAPVAVRIRGISTFGNNDPLYIIDGVPRKGSYQNAINPNDIESIQILKDASAASIYGARAGNGVIIITTKKGKSGEPKITYEASYGSQSPIKFVKVLNAQEWATMRFKALANAGLKPEGANAALYGTGTTPVFTRLYITCGSERR
jgi:TonB-dependent SusC/RagA subfamily outer membrane receptor